MNIFFRGLAAILPITGTIYLIYWLIATLERAVGQLLSPVIGQSPNIPGIGIILTFLVIYLTGLLLGLLPFQKLLSKIQTPFRNIPLIKSIYSALEDLLKLFDTSDKENKGRVVEVKIGNDKGINVMGLLTSTSIEHTKENLYAVYIPVSYQIGGYTIFVKPDQITYIDITVEELMKSALTAWIKK